MNLKANRSLFPSSLCALLLSTASLSAAWTTGVPISTSPASTNPTPSNLAIDPNSNAIAGWLAGNIGVDNSLYTASLPAGAPGWSAPISLYNGAYPEFSTFPILFADQEGMVEALWAAFTQDGTVFDQVTIFNSSKEILGSTWPAPIAMAPIAGFTSGGSVQVDEQGNKIAVLALNGDSSMSGPPASIYLVSMPQGATSWNTPMDLGSDMAASQPAVFATASQGGAVIGWRLGTTLQTARYTFATDELVAINDISLPSGTTDIGFVRGFLAPNGDAVVAFGVTIGLSSDYIIYYSLLPHGSDTWTFPEMLSNPANNTTGMYLSIHSDANANSIFLWGELTPSSNVFIRTASLPFGGALSPIVDLTDSNPPVTTSADSGSGLLLDVDAFGNAVAIWLLVSDGLPTVQVASQAVGGGWSAPEILSTSGMLPRIALSDQGTAVATWIDTGTNLLQASSNNQLFALSGPSGFTGYIVKEGGMYSLKTHWTESQAPNIVSYEIFKDGVLIANVAASGPFEYVQSLDSKWLDGFYTLIAVASNGNKSIPIGLSLSN